MRHHPTKARDISQWYPRLGGLPGGQFVVNVIHPFNNWLVEEMYPLVKKSRNANLYTTSVVDFISRVHLLQTPLYNDESESFTVSFKSNKMFAR